jgi:spore maturation protein CgeB
MSLKILFIGSLGTGQTSLERMKALQDLGHEVASIEAQRHIALPFRILNKVLALLGWFPDFAGLNRDIVDKFKSSSRGFDVVWIEKGTAIWPRTLRALKAKNPKPVHLVHFNPDDPFGHFDKGWGLFLKTIPLYDVHFVSRVPNVAEYKARGAKVVFDYDRSFSKLLHRPLQLDAAEQAEFSTQVGFVGSYAPDRAAMIAYLIENDIPVAVYGNGWENKPHWQVIAPHFRSKGRMGEAYVKMLNGMHIALHFLRRENRDEQDSRSFEIPACGVFMLAERSPKHESFFQENEEAVFFDTKEELLEKVRFYIKNPEKVSAIAHKGYLRAIHSGYDHHSRMAHFIALATAQQLHEFGHTT